MAHVLSRKLNWLLTPTTGFASNKLIDGAVHLEATQLLGDAQPQVLPQPSRPHVVPATPATLAVHVGTHATGVDMHVPLVVHVCPAVHEPQVPPQPSLPQVFPAQFFVHTGVTTLHLAPSVEQAGVLEGHVPHEPPQPLLPQTRPLHTGVQTAGVTAQVPEVLHVDPVLQLPHVPPQPLAPHCFPVHAGVHVFTHSPAELQVCVAFRAQLPRGTVPQ